MTASPSAVAELLASDHDRLLHAWLEQLRAQASADLRIDAATLQAQARTLLQAITDALRSGGDDVEGAAWDDARRTLEEISRLRVKQGFSSDQTATFVFSLKQPLFALLRERFGNDAAALGDAVWQATALVDALGLYTVRAYQRTREDVIARQQTELLELSTPVVKLWDGILALPMIGTLDSARTQVVMESLLRRIVETGSEIAIIDITGVPTVDTLVAQHLLKTVTAIRLMGAECIISGVRPQIAQTIVHLGIDLQGVQTKATIADALRSALRHIGAEVSLERAANDGAVR
jgi:rsbT co-antagonist protein RsbR